MVQRVKCVGESACHLIDVVEKIRGDVSIWILGSDSCTLLVLQYSFQPVEHISTLASCKQDADVLGSDGGVVESFICFLKFVSQCPDTSRQRSVDTRRFLAWSSVRCELSGGKVSDLQQQYNLWASARTLCKSRAQVGAGILRLWYAVDHTVSCPCCMRWKSGFRLS